MPGRSTPSITPTSALNTPRSADRLPKRPAAEVRGVTIEQRDREQSPSTARRPCRSCWRGSSRDIGAPRVALSLASARTTAHRVGRSAAAVPGSKAAVPSATDRSIALQSTPPHDSEEQPPDHEPHDLTSESMDGSWIPNRRRRSAAPPETRSRTETTGSARLRKSTAASRSRGAICPERNSAERHLQLDQRGRARRPEGQQPDRESIEEPNRRAEHHRHGGEQPVARSYRHSRHRPDRGDDHPDEQHDGAGSRLVRDVVGDRFVHRTDRPREADNSSRPRRPSDRSTTRPTTG